MGGITSVRRYFISSSQSRNYCDRAQPEQKDQDHHNLHSGSAALRRNPINMKYQKLKQSLTSSEVPCNRTSVPPRFQMLKINFFLMLKKNTRAGCFIFIWNVSTCPHLFCTKPFQVQWKSMPGFKHRQLGKLLDVANISIAPFYLLLQQQTRPTAAS